MHDRIMQICTYDLFQFAYIPSWYEQLYELSQLAAPEPWRFRQPSYETQNTETPILERYINQVFRKQAIDYSCAPEGQAGQIFYLNQEFACFHTGLNTNRRWLQRHLQENPDRYWRDGEAHGQGAVPLHPRPVCYETPWQADAGAGIRPARGRHCQHRPR